MKFAFYAGPRGPVFEENADRKGRRFYRHIPERGWSPLLGCEYEVSVVRLLETSARGCAELRVVRPVDAARDEGAYYAAEDENRRQEEEKRQDAIRRESSKEFCAIVEQELRPKFPLPVAFFFEFPFGEIQSGRAYGLSSWEERRLAEKARFLLDLPEQTIARVGVLLGTFRATVKERGAECAARHDAAMARRDIAEKRIEEIRKSSGSMIREIDFKGQKHTVRIDGSREEVLVYGRHTVSWPESEDGYRPAGSAERTDWHKVWQDITDPELVAEIVRRFGDELPRLSKEVAIEETYMASAEKERREIIRRAWAEIITAYPDPVISEQGRRLEGEEWKFAH